MNTLQKTAAALGVIALTFAAVWLGFVIPWMEQVPRKYEAAFSYMARSTVAEAPGAPLAIESFIEHHAEHVVASQGNTVLVEMTATFVEISRGDILFQATDKIWMNRKSRLIKGGDVLLLFPHKLQKRNYLVRRFPYFPEEGVLFVFEGEEDVKGLRSYRFSFSAENLDWSANYPDFPLPEGISIRARDWGTVWVEPRTGIMVKHEEQWESVLSGEAFHGAPVDVGEMWFLPDTVVRQVFVASNERRRLLLHTWVAPGAMILMGALLLFMACPFHRGLSR
jgi:hypothetical protein